MSNKDLFSSTTHAVPRNHGEIVAVFKRLEVVDCDVFYSMVGRAINSYFEQEHPLHHDIPDKTRSFARTVSIAVRQAVDYVSQEEEPELSLEETVAFDPLQLRTHASARDSEFDTSLTRILRGMDKMNNYRDGNQETFMFKVAMPNSHESLIPEITRTDHSYSHRPEHLPTVSYGLTFAAFEE